MFENALLIWHFRLRNLQLSAFGTLLKEERQFLS